MKVYMMPTPSMARTDTTNSIHQIVLRLQKELPKFGVEITEHRAEADLVAAHAGQTDGIRECDIAHVHGLYPTAHFPEFEWHWWANTSVINNVKHSKITTVPSEWVADLFRRDMHLNPQVVGWGIDFDEWEPCEHKGYVLWNKTRVDRVCDPTPMLELARTTSKQLFLTTFGNGTPNVKTIGRVPFEEMKEYVRHAQVYLATTKETFGIGILEAMACGIPILGYRWGAITDIVAHGVTGYLAQPGNLRDLQQGLQYCIQNREALGANARKVAMQYTWERVARKFSDLYKLAAVKHDGIKVSVVIPCHNYERYVGEAIDSVARQITTFRYEIVVINDSSTDNSSEVIQKHLDKSSCDWTFDIVDCGNPADSRNRGIQASRGDYIVCLDADDILGNSHFLQLLADNLDKDPTLGIAYTGLRLINEDGSMWAPNEWPGPFDFEQQVKGKNQVPTCCMFRKEAWQRAGGYKSKYCPAEDAELWTHITFLGYDAKQITRDSWFSYRLHDNSLSSPVREGKRPNVDWMEDKGWAKSGHVPFASGGNPLRSSWPVRNYDDPLVSVIIPVGPYHMSLVSKAIDSVENQSEFRWEIVLVNDSGLDMLDLHRKYPFIKVVTTPGGCGAAYARNRGIEYSSAPLVTFLDADDELHPKFLEMSLLAFQRTGRYVYTDWISETKDGALEVHETPIYDPNEVFRRTSIHSINVLIPRSYCLDVGMFDESMGTWEDVDFFMKLAAHGYCGIRVNQPLITYRYRTGKLRERGEIIKDNIKANLRGRYGDYIEGRKMCGCLNGGSLAGEGSAISGNSVKIEYMGAIGTHQVTGPMTKKDYGRRQRGDIFYIDATDLDGYTEIFRPITDIVAAQMSSTPVPELI